MSASMVRRNWLSLLKFLCVFTILHLVTTAIDASANELHTWGDNCPLYEHSLAEHWLLLDLFLCRKCGNEILEAEHLVNSPTQLALRQRNDTFGPKKGVLIQLFKNPHGAMFEVVTASRLKNVFRASEMTAGDTWWSGYFWRILGCPQCGAHIGWEYIPMDKTNTEHKTFFGLVLNNLLYENDADSLLVIPKSYSS